MESESLESPGLRGRIEAEFESWGHFLFRHAWLAIGLILLVSMAVGSQLPKLELDTSPEGFLHADDPALLAYKSFRASFGRESVIMVAIRPPEIFDLDFLANLRALHKDLEREVPQLEEITSLVNVRSTHAEGDELVVRELGAEWPRSAADLPDFKHRVLANPFYRDLLISRDGRLTTIVMQTEAYTSIMEDSDALAGFDESDDADGGTVNRRFVTGAEDSAIVAAIHNVVDRYRSPDFATYVAGGPCLAVELQAAMLRDMSRFVMLSIGTIALLLFVLFRRLSGVILPLVVVLLSLSATLGLMAFTGTPLRVPTQIIPSFLLAVGIGASVHVLAIFLRSYQQGGSKEDAIAYALGHSGLAVVMTSLTTAGGLLSFAAADLAPIAEFGLFGPAGVMLQLVFTLVLLPALVAVLPLGRRRSRSQRPPVLDRLLQVFGEIATRRPWPIIAVSTVLIVISLVGVSRIRRAHNLLLWLPQAHPLRVATELIDRELHGTMSLEVLIKSQKENALYDPALLNRIDMISREAEGFESETISVGKTVSIADVVKEIHQALNEDRPDAYTIPQDRAAVAQELLLFESSGSDDLETVTDSRFSTARLTIRVPWIDAGAYSPFIAHVQKQLTRLFPSSTMTEVTGGMALTVQAFHAVMTSLIRSYIIALIVITPLMVFLIGSLRGGLLAMIPNLTPIIIMLGFMGWSDIALDPFTLLIGCIAIGLAVDDTIHFMHNYRRYLLICGDFREAIHRTLQTTGRAMLFTTLVLTAGFFTYMLSSMKSLANFGFLIGFALIVAFLADVLILPALLTIIEGRGRRVKRPAPEVLEEERVVPHSQTGG